MNDTAADAHPAIGRNRIFDVRISTVMRLEMKADSEDEARRLALQAAFGGVGEKHGVERLAEAKGRIESVDVLPDPTGDALRRLAGGASGGAAIR